MLASLRFSLSGALLLFGLFAGQLVMPGIVAAVPSLARILPAEQVHPVFSAAYVVLAIILFLRRPKSLWNLAQGLRGEPAAQSGAK
jgi:hypothetical protein